MDTSQNQGVVDQLFRAIDDKDYTIARYKLCRAIEAEIEEDISKTQTTPDCEGQA